jgi:acyl-coenzyme A synthetase/AMP-(fatty) acid ligase
MERLRRLAAASPDRTAVVTETRQVSYAELWREAVGVSFWLRRHGLAPGDVVGITIKDEYRNFVATLASLHAGFANVTLATHEPVAQREATAARVGAVAVITEDQGQGLPSLPWIVPDFGVRTEIAEDAPLPQSGDGTALFLSSSGTTGRAKLIPVGQGQLLAQSATYQWPRRHNVFYRPASVEFNNSKRQRLYTLVAGDENVFADPARHDIRETCARSNVTWLGLSAAQARVLMSRGGSPLPQMTHIRMGGSAVPPRLRREIVARLSPNTLVAYGTSEMGSVATAGPSDHAADVDTMGQVHPGIEFELVDENDSAVPTGSTGRIRMRSAGMPALYWDDPEASARAFRDGWFYPGDMARRDRSGRLIFNGRSDDMMILASINVFPAEIEHVVEELPGVVECAAFAMKSEEFGDVPMVAVVANAGVAAEAIQAHARQILGLRAPRRVYLVDSLPRSREGKVRRSELTRLFAGQQMEKARA